MLARTASGLAVLSLLSSKFECTASRRAAGDMGARAAPAAAGVACSAALELGRTGLRRLPAPGGGHCGCMQSAPGCLCSMSMCLLRFSCGSSTASQPAQAGTNCRLRWRCACVPVHWLCASCTPQTISSTQPYGAKLLSFLGRRKVLIKLSLQVVQGPTQRLGVLVTKCRLEVCAAQAMQQP